EWLVCRPSINDGAAERTAPAVKAFIAARRSGPVMSAVAARRSRAPETPKRRKGAKRRMRASRPQKLEQRMLLTATLCLVAFGAVMVYSASSATTLLQGRGNGSGYLIKFLV